jgi:hypothetical protein
LTAAAGGDNIAFSGAAALRIMICGGIVMKIGVEIGCIWQLHGGVRDAG